MKVKLENSSRKTVHIRRLKLIKLYSSTCDDIEALERRVLLGDPAEGSDECFVTLEQRLRDLNTLADRLESEILTLGERLS